MLKLTIYKKYTLIMFLKSNITAEGRTRKKDVRFLAAVSRSAPIAPGFISAAATVGFHKSKRGNLTHSRRRLALPPEKIFISHCKIQISQCEIYIPKREIYISNAQMQIFAREYKKSPRRKQKILREVSKNKGVKKPFSP